MADNAYPQAGGQFVISLDFELLWGVRDHSDVKSYGANILGARAAIPRILELFAQHDIAATWATVGFLFCRDRDELMASLPPPELRPSYHDARLSSYAYLDEVGQDEDQDPYRFGASLIDEIKQTPRQEIATHTLSHYYCLEPGQTVEQFAADLKAAIALAGRHGVTLGSIVFPRNQYDREHLEACKALGMTAYRGVPSPWIYRSGAGADQTPLRRAGRLLDAHTGLFGDTSFAPSTDNPANVPASQFLRPCSGRLARLHPLHTRTIKNGMTRAAKVGRGYHLWWHPHNFGQNIDGNITHLSEIIRHFRTLKERFGMESLSMCDFP